MTTQANSTVQARKPLSAEERELLAQVQRLLVNVSDPVIAAKAAKAGYDDAEHALGWRLWTMAAGTKRAFTHHLGEADRVLADASDETRANLKALDDFENTWFERPRFAIRRFIPALRREAVELAFYAGLSQQPEGPAVVGSVEALLERLAGLAKSDEPGAKEAHASLVKKGLTAGETGRVKELLAGAKKLGGGTRGRPPTLPRARPSSGARSRTSRTGTTTGRTCSGRNSGTTTRCASACARSAAAVAWRPPTSPGRPMPTRRPTAARRPTRPPARARSPDASRPGPTSPSGPSRGSIAVDRPPV